MVKKKKRKNIVIRFFEWLEKSNQKAVKSGLCGG